MSEPLRPPKPIDFSKGQPTPEEIVRFQTELSAYFDAKGVKPEPMTVGRSDAAPIVLGRRLREDEIQKAADDFFAGHLSRERFVSILRTL